MQGSESAAMSEHESGSGVSEGEISLMDVLIVIARHKWIIFGLPVAAAILAAAYSLTLPNVFSASTKILPPQQNQSAVSTVVSQLAGLGFGGVGGKGQNDLYLAMLRSRRVADGIIQRFDLNNVFRQTLQSNTRMALAGMTTISSEKEGTISIEVDDTDPKRAAMLANAYVDELFKLTSILAVTEASKRRLFFERQVALAKESLTKAEAAAKQSLERGGITQVEGQSRAMLTATSSLRAQITAKEVQIGAMRTYASEGNPDLILVQQELETPQRALEKLEGIAAGKGSEKAPTKDVQGAHSLSLIREVKYYETVYDLLARQFELAKIEEAKDGAIIQVLDAAIVPDLKSKPNRTRIVVWSAFVALLVGFFGAFLLEANARSSLDSAHAGRLAAFKRALTGS